MDVLPMSGKAASPSDLIDSRRASRVPGYGLSEARRGSRGSAREPGKCRPLRSPLAACRIPTMIPGRDDHPAKEHAADQNPGHPSPPPGEDLAAEVARLQAENAESASSSGDKFPGGISSSSGLCGQGRTCWSACPCRPTHTLKGRSIGPTLCETGSWRSPRLHHRLS